MLTGSGEVQIGKTSCMLFYTIRKAKDMTQSEIAKKLGTSQAKVSQIENYRSLPSKIMLRRMSDLTGLSMDQLTGVKPIMRCEL